MADDTQRGKKDNTDRVLKPRHIGRPDVAPRGSMGIQPVQPRPGIAPGTGSGPRNPPSPPAEGEKSNPPTPPNQPRPSLQGLKVGANDTGKLSAHFKPEANKPAQARPQTPTPAKPALTAEQALGAGVAQKSVATKDTSAKIDTSSRGGFTKAGPARNNGRGHEKPSTQLSKSKGLEI